MRSSSGLLMVLAVSALGGCVTNESMQEAGRQMKGDAANRQARIERCIQANPMVGHDGWLFARELRMKPGPEATRTLCTRVADAIIAGRIDAGDFDRLRATGSPSPRLMNVLLGR